MGQHLNDLHLCVAPIYRRISDNATWWQNALDFFVTLTHAKQRCEVWQTRLDPADLPVVDKFMKKLDQLEKWFNSTMSENERVPLWKDRPFTPKAMADRHTELRLEYTQLKERYGSGGFANFQTADGSKVRPDEIEGSGKGNWMQKVRNADLDELEEIEAMDDDDDDAL
jgi:hypothetical protein